CVLSSLASPFSMHVTASSWLFTLSLHDALPISRLELPYLSHGIYGHALRCHRELHPLQVHRLRGGVSGGLFPRGPELPGDRSRRDRKSTRLNSSHVKISYAVFCLKKKNRT